MGPNTYVCNIEISNKNRKKKQKKIKSNEIKMVFEMSLNNFGSDAVKICFSFFFKMKWQNEIILNIDSIRMKVHEDMLVPYRIRGEVLEFNLSLVLIEQTYDPK